MLERLGLDVLGVIPAVAEKDKGILYQLAKRQKEKDGDVRTEPRDGEHLGQLVEEMFNGIYTIQGFSQKGRFDYIMIDTPPVDRPGGCPADARSDGRYPAGGAAEPGDQQPGGRDDRIPGKDRNSYEFWRICEVSFDLVDYPMFCHYNKNHVKNG